MAGAILPVYRWQIFDNGVMAPGAKAYFYASGTGNAQAVYSDEALTVPHAQPVVADAEGVLPVIFLQALAYRVTVTDSAGATIFPAQDNILNLADVATPTQAANLVYAGPTSGAAAIPTFRALVAADLPASATLLYPMVCEGRLTLTTGVPVTTADVTAATSVYFTPFNGNRIALYSGSAWVIRSFAELTQSLAGFTASLPYDIFAYDNAGTVALEALVWTNTTTRATALVLQDGVWCKTGALTRRYLGTVYINSTGGQTDDTLTKRSVYNAQNRVVKPLRRLEDTNSYTYNSSFRQANGSALNEFDVMVGLAEDPIDIRIDAMVSNDSTSELHVVAVALDGTSAAAAGSILSPLRVPVVSVATHVSASLRTVPAVGRHRFVWIETASSGGGTATWYGDANTPTTFQAGMHGLWRC